MMNKLLVKVEETLLDSETGDLNDTGVKIAGVIFVISILIVGFVQ